MHPSLVGRLQLDAVLNGHSGCVNTIAWNRAGSLLVSGSDDTNVSSALPVLMPAAAAAAVGCRPARRPRQQCSLRGLHAIVVIALLRAFGGLLTDQSPPPRVVARAPQINIWDYCSRALLLSAKSGHSQNVFCTKFVPETGDALVASGAGDGEVRVNCVSQLGRKGAAAQSHAVFGCHSRRVKKLAVEEGNPYLVWSASEDGTLRQHDLREPNFCSAPLSSHEECRSILLDLRSAAKRSLLAPPKHPLALKTCALSPTRPHHLLVGGSDAFARLYDRRMLPGPGSLSPSPEAPAPVCYFAPAHLSNLSRSSSLHLTHVTFSPDGREVLLSYSGEHVYLMDANNLQDGDMLYTAADAAARCKVAPLSNGTSRSSLPRAASGQLTGSRARIYKDLEALFERAKLLMCSKEDSSSRDYTLAAALCTEVLEEGGREAGPGLQHDCLCMRANAYRERNWKNDLHMAVRDCHMALKLDCQSPFAHRGMALALEQLGRNEEALHWVVRAHQLDPLDPDLCACLTEIRRKAETGLAATRKRLDVKKLSDKSSGAKPGNQPEAAQPSQNSSASQLEATTDHHGRQTEDEEQSQGSASTEDLEEDAEGGEEDEGEGGSELDLEIEVESAEATSPRGGGTEEGGRERGVPRMSLRVRRRDRATGGEAASTSGRCAGVQERRQGARRAPAGGRQGPDDVKAERAVDMRQRYVGHCNTGTDIKQANFLGDRGDFVASGSDDGRWFIWEKKTGRLVKMFLADGNGALPARPHILTSFLPTIKLVNCVQSHPIDCVVATSGIDSTIKLWSPHVSDAAERNEAEMEPLARITGPHLPDAVEMDRVMADNQQRMRRPRDLGLISTALTYNPWPFYNGFEWLKALRVALIGLTAPQAKNVHTLLMRLHGLRVTITSPL
eukprot:SM000340S12919  [mRNA]  locus=s340:68574:74516:+ [translate_table: standard]